jgi:hypothetical protein
LRRREAFKVVSLAFHDGEDEVLKIQLEQAEALSLGGAVRSAFNDFESKQS